MAIFVWLKTKLKHSLLEPITKEPIIHFSDCSLNVDVIKKLLTYLLMELSPSGGAAKSFPAFYGT
jgi:hypothetical protein